MRAAAVIVAVALLLSLLYLVTRATPRTVPSAPVAYSTRSGAPHELSAERKRTKVYAPAVRSVAAPRYSGTATWYCSTVATCTRGYRPGDLIGAIDRKDSSFRQGDRVTVRAFGRAVTVTIVDTCACGGVRVIDLSRAAFAHLANPDLGVIPVTLEFADAPLPTGPATDIEVTP